MEIFAPANAILKCRLGWNDSEDDLDTRQMNCVYQCNISNPQPPSYAFNFCQLEVQLCTCWIDGHSSSIKHSNNYQQNCFNLSGSRLNFKTLIRKDKVCNCVQTSTKLNLISLIK